jgi:NADH-quinone oxidoreductase subunit F
MNNPASIEEYVATGGFQALKKAIAISGADILDEMKDANLRGRGGAGFPLDIKWRGMYEAAEYPKYIVCNADESEPGTFKDKKLLETDPLCVIEGMLIAAWLFRSEKSYIYIRGEYRVVQDLFQEALDNAKKAGYIGRNILGINGFDHTISIISGSGAYICGENSALLNSIEGGIGRPRIKPSHEMGLYGKPTIVNNVETFACVPLIVEHGGKAFLKLGDDSGGGTKLIALSGHIKNRGVYEIPLGMPIQEILYSEEYGGGTSTGRPIQFCHFGGQSGPIGFDAQLQGEYSYGGLKENDLSVGSGAIVVMDYSVDILLYLKKVLEFFAHESCGRCTPCRIGIIRIIEHLELFINGSAQEGDIEKLMTLITNVTKLSACGLGQSAGTALKSCLKHRRDDFEARIGGLR